MGFLVRLLAVIGVIAILVVIAGVIYLFAGFYDVAADAQEPDVVSSALVSVRQASVARRAAGLTPPVSMSDNSVIQSGARAFARVGCVNCHGAPGATWAKFSEGLEPAAPDLKEVGPPTDPAQLFWIIKHGIRMTAMPSFSKVGVEDDEIWTLAAFVKNLDKISEADFKAWTAPPAEQGVTGAESRPQ